MSTKFQGVSSSLLLYTSIIVVLVIVVCVNLVAARLNLRWDVTQDKVYSLSEGTRQILADLDTDITIKVFYTRGLVNTPVSIRTYAGRMLDFLSEYVHHGNHRIHLEEYDPQMDTEEEEWARRYGIHPLSMPTGEPLYFGLVVLGPGQEDVVPFLDPARERQLEYDITRLITRVQTVRRPTIGIISGLPVFGQSPPMGFAMPGQPNTPPWLFVTELRKTYTVREIHPGADSLGGEADLLILLHPRNVSDNLLQAVDRYVREGGNLLIYTDPFSVTDPVTGQSSVAALEKLFEAWGIHVATDRVLMDLHYPTRLRGPDQRVESNPLWLSLTPAAMNAEHVLTAQLESLLLPVAGAIEVLPDLTLDYEPLLRASDAANLVENYRVQAGVEALRQDFVSSPETYDLAAILTGIFPAASFEDSVEETNAGAVEGTAPADEPVISRPATVVVVTDADLLFDGYYVDHQNFLGFEMSRIFNDNLNLLLNACELLTGSPSLIAIRSRGSIERPFTRVQELERRAQARWLEREQELVRQIEATNQKLSQLDQQKDPSQQFIISPEQEAEVQRFREERMRINQELKTVRRNLRAEIDALGGRLKLINILLMPLLVAAAGIVYATWRRRKAQH